MQNRIDISITNLNSTSSLKKLLGSIAQLSKARLSALVVFSSVLSALIVSAGTVPVSTLVYLIFGGFFVSGSASGANQWIERDLDRLMQRTKNRPLANRSFDSAAALVFIGFSAIGGLLLLYLISPKVALLSGLSWFLYVFLYTPMKRFSPFAVFVGAIPGALPVLIGTVAVEGHISLFGFLLFGLQFLWQFPHFWSIAWLADTDYKTAGFRLLPTIDGKKSEVVGWQSFSYASLLIPVGALMWYNGYIGWITLALSSLVTLYYILTCWIFYKEESDMSARRVMFTSFAYLPVTLVVLFIGILIG